MLRAPCLLVAVAVAACDSSPVSTALDAAAGDAQVPGGSDGGERDAATPDMATLEPPRGFVVTATVKLDSPRPGLPVELVPSEDHFNLYLQERATIPVMILSAPGAGGTLNLDLDHGADSWHAKGQADLWGTRAPVPETCQGVAGMTYTEITAVREGDNLRGTVKGNVQFLTGDVLRSLPFTGTFTGAVDRQPPRFTIAGPVHPADFLSVVVSEALPPGTQAYLQAIGGAVVPLLPNADATSAVTAFSSNGRIGQRAGYRLVVTPAPRDLAGNVTTDPLPVLETQAVPLLPADGFEGATPPLLQGSAAVVGAERFPPISGQRSLLFPPDYLGPARVSLRLRVAPGQTRVRGTVRAIFGPNTPLALTPALTAIALDGNITTGKVDPPAEPFTMADAMTIMGAPQPLQFALPDGTSEEVLIDLSRDGSCGPGGSSMGFLLDDLRVE